MKTLNLTEKEFYNFISLLSDSEKRLLKDTIKYGSWGDVDFEFRVNSHTITSHCYGYITNDAKLGGNFSGREVSCLFRRLYKKICPYKGDQKKCKWGLGDIISHYSNWWANGSGDVLFIREDAVDFFEKWAKTEEEPNQEPETKFLFSGIDCENEGKKRFGSLIEYPNGECVIVEFDNNGEELSWDVIPESVELQIIKE